MNRLLLTGAVFVLAASQAGAQRMKTYASAIENGTYKEISGGTVVKVEDTGEDFNNLVIDGSSTGNFDPFTGQGFPIGFDFEYNNQKMNQFMIGTNGYLLLGKDEVKASCTSNPFLLFYEGKDRNAIGIVPISEVRDIPETELSYKVEGEAPERQLVVQFKNLVITDRFSYNMADTVQVQFRLYEKNGNLSISCNGFKPWSGADMSYMSLKAGILGDYGDCLTLTDFTSGKSSAGDNLITWSSDSYPADGVTYTFVAPQDGVAPVTQPSALTLSSTTSRVRGSFTKADDADSYLVLLSEGQLTATPEDGRYYAAGDKLGDAVVVAAGDNTSFASGESLKASTDYNVYVLAYNAKCKNGPLYNTKNPLTGTVKTMPGEPDSLSVVSTDANTMSLLLQNKGDYDIMVAMTDSVSRRGNGQMMNNNGVFGTPTGKYKVGDEIDGGGKVVYIGRPGGFSVDNLLPGTAYYFNAWTTDGKGSYSSDATSAGAYTAAYLPWEAGIDKMALFSNPVGWTCQGDFSPQRGGYIQNKVDNDKGGQTWIETPDIYLSEGQNRAVATLTMESFGYYSTDPYVFGEGDSLRVQVTADGKTFKDIAVYTKDNDPGFKGTDKFSKLQWTFADEAGKKVKLRFYINSTKGYQFSLKDLSLFAKPECDYPVDLKVDSVHGDKADISWTPQGSEKQWQVVYRSSADEAWSEPVVTDAAKYTLDGLKSFSSYDVKVRAICPADAYSEWADSVSFMSALYIPFDINIADVTSGMEGWNSYSGALADPTQFEDSYGFSSYSGQLYFSSYDDQCDEWYVSPELDVEKGATYAFDFDITTNNWTSWGTPSTDNQIMLAVSSDGEKFYTKDVIDTISYDEYKEESKAYSFHKEFRSNGDKARLGIYVKSTTGNALAFYINRLALKKVDETAIHSASNTPVAGREEVFNYAGQRLNGSQKGLQIVRTADGKVKKIFKR